MTTGQPGIPQAGHGESAEACEHEWQAYASWYDDGSTDAWLECTKCHEIQPHVFLSAREFLNAELVGELWGKRPK